MDKKIEEEIIKTYVKKNKQERILWELSNPKKRKSVIWKFHSPDIFIEKYLYPAKYMDAQSMKNYLFDLSGTLKVYYIGTNYIGFCSLEKAVEWAAEEGVYIIYCGNGIGYYQGEQEYGAPPRFILLAQKTVNKLT